MNIKPRAGGIHSQAGRREPNGGAGNLVAGYRVECQHLVVRNICDKDEISDGREADRRGEAGPELDDAAGAGPAAEVPSDVERAR